jgi:hypothetical protein
MLEERVEVTCFLNDNVQGVTPNRALLRFGLFGSDRPSESHGVGELVWNPSANLIPDTIKVTGTKLVYDIAFSPERIEPIRKTRRSRAREVGMCACSTSRKRNNPLTGREGTKCTKKNTKIITGERSRGRRITVTQQTLLK